jgi:oxepin-CoA hydrolase/3-oxo-5,6-dehydrosuberyl-CoA semialdehyde dehydrogenase
VRVNIEADSINSAVLGPDVESGSDTFEQFLGNVVVDMTQKAVRSALPCGASSCPRSLVAEVQDALVERLRAIRVGNPLDADVRMGPVASQDQLREVRSGITRLREVSDVLLGGETPMPGKGYFVSPTLLRARRKRCRSAARARGVRTLRDAAALVWRRQHCSRPLQPRWRCAGRERLQRRPHVHGATRARDRPMAWAGVARQREDARTGSGPGAVLPATIHGGPGRAGGGEELGGLRGLQPYLQRTAIQGDRAVVLVFRPGRGLGRLRSAVRDCCGLGRF